MSTAAARMSPAWVALKLRQRLSARTHAAQARWGHRLGIGKPSRLGRPLLPWSPLAAPPGDSAHLPWAVGRVRDEAMSALAEEVRAHHFWLLGPTLQHCAVEAPARRSRIAEIANELPAAAVAAYRPIDWHIDLHSGYRWPEDEFYLDVRIGPEAGADIKLPRELSRFQHVGALARGDLEAGGVEFLLQVIDWIVANPVRIGVNWGCAMDVALRAINWIWGLRLFEPAVERYPGALSVIADSLRDHGRHIESNLEYYEDSTGNHYLSDIAGLVYIGAACPDFPEADRWLLFGLQELVSEMHREVYEDGGAHEASTHYHRLVAELFTSCAALAERVPAERRIRLTRVDRRGHKVRPRLRAPEDSGLNLTGEGALLPAFFYARLARMAEFTAGLTKPNGLVPQFGDNDSARVHKLLPSAEEEFRAHAHVAATVGLLLDRADLETAGSEAADEARLVAGGLRGRVATPPAVADLTSDRVDFIDSGIAIRRHGPAWLAVICGPNGQGGRGGHGHNDKNSFELNVGGVDFIVDGGCPAYSSAPDVRNRFRGTAAHSTLFVAGEEQDRWTPGQAGLFRLVERSAPRLQLESDGSIIGRHIGFGAEHRRIFRLKGTELEIDDLLEEPRERWLNFNLDPAVSVHGLASDGVGTRFELRHAAGPVIRGSVTGATAGTTVPGAFSIGYGQARPNLALRLRMTGAEAATRLSWAS